MTIESRRAHEMRKYLTLLSTDYGSTNHGAGAVPLARSWRPAFVADFGCGRNLFIAGLRAEGIAGVGIDFAFPEADVAAPMHATGLADGVADVVTSFDAMEHLLPEDVPLALAEMRRVGTAGGRFVFSISTRDSTWRVDGETLHPTVRPMSWWVEQIEAVGRVGVVGDYVVGDWR